MPTELKMPLLNFTKLILVLYVGGGSLLVYLNIAVDRSEVAFAYFY